MSILDQPSTQGLSRRQAWGLFWLFAAAVLAPHRTSAQSGAATINFDSVNPLTLPDDIYFGEVGGVATNSRGDVFVYTRTGHPTMSLASAAPTIRERTRS